jgi:hypothetical protein
MTPELKHFVAQSKGACNNCIGDHLLPIGLPELKTEPTSLGGQLSARPRTKVNTDKLS